MDNSRSLNSSYLHILGWYTNQIGQREKKIWFRYTQIYYDIETWFNATAYPITHLVNERSWVYRFMKSKIWILFTMLHNKNLVKYKKVFQTMGQLSQMGQRGGRGRIKLYLSHTYCSLYTFRKYTFRIIWIPTTGNYYWCFFFKPPKI